MPPWASAAASRVVRFGKLVMASFLALYTKNTTQKAKTWLDGTITATPAGTNRVSVVLKTEHGVEIETDFVKLCVEGEELELERHLVLVVP